MKILFWNLSTMGLIDDMSQSIVDEVQNLMSCLASCGGIFIFIILIIIIKSHI